MEKTAKIKKPKTYKNPDIRSAIFAVIIIAMFILLVNPETRQYEEIVARRNQVGEMVGTSNINENDLMTGHEECIRELDELEKTSRLGAFIVKCDHTLGGKIINYFVVYGMRLLVVYLGCHTLHQIWLLGVYFYRKAKVSKANHKPQDQ